MNLLKALNWRYAVNTFTQQTIEQPLLDELLEATRLSPSSFGLQPYRILVTRSEQLRRKLTPYSYGQEKVLHCSHLVIFAAQTDVSENTVDNYIQQVASAQNVTPTSLNDYADKIKQAINTMSRQQKQQWAHQQAYIALGNMLTSAAILNIDTCPIGGFDQRGFDDVLQLTSMGLTTTVICSIGVRHPEDKNSQRPKVRMNLQDLVTEL
ncbi:NAD(P)H-dependent oxidoreductase [Agaribacter marinus]|uniref:NAD(P)H-dependent oxidoreductase n=1 Tax=Agaribacter marinus TaxID=1431249 RepID=A0AA37WK02_9ALTE|nr:NAD(P)H-dependent oxidoreductase [Agaribacter marinus]GLR70445.1 NAD(P)H-dependent oxidoreductase [Agaribacter marinus]